MLSLHEYATGVYDYASHAALRAHVHTTVLAPLGLDACCRCEQTQTNNGNDGHDDSSSHNDDDVQQRVCNCYTRLFALPPCTTNVRLCGDDVTRRSVQLAAQLRAMHTTTSTHDSTTTTVQDDDDEKNEDDGAVRAHDEPHEECGWRRCYAAVQWLDALGMPFAAVVMPRAYTTTTTTTPSPSPSPSSSSCTTTPRHDDTHGLSTLPAVLIDASCAEAVLRGSDVYMPGVVAVSTHFATGARVRLLWLVQRDVTASSTSSRTSRLRPAVAPPHCSFAQLLRRLAVSSSSSSSSSNGNGSSDDGVHTTVFAVCVGLGVARTSAKDMLQQRHCNNSNSSAARGVAVQTTWTPMQQPSQRVLASLLSQPSPAQLFLHNYSSMVPVKLLVDRLVLLQQQRQQQQQQQQQQQEEVSLSWRVLDACAAPGGKASLLLSLLIEATRSTACGVRGFHLDCCERSAARCAQLHRTLTAHFAVSAHTQPPAATATAAAATAAVTNASTPTAADMTEAVVNKSIDSTSTATRQRDAHAATLVWSDAQSSAYVCHDDVLRRLRSLGTQRSKRIDSTSSSSSSMCGVDDHTVRVVKDKNTKDDAATAYHAILLDAPCTGLGLRPRLLPHTLTCADVRAAAAYQYKLLDACVAAVQPAHDRHSSHNDTMRTAAAAAASNGVCQRAGVLVYSTCTLTREENEGNVLQLLRTHAHVRLARAHTAAERALCLQLHTTRYPDAPRHTRRERNTRSNNNDDSHKQHEDGRDSNSDDNDDDSMAGGVRFLLQRDVTAAQRSNEAWLRARGVHLDNGVDDATAPLLVLRFMPRHHAATLSSPSRTQQQQQQQQPMLHDLVEDGVGFFVAVFEVYTSTDTTTTTTEARSVVAADTCV